MWCSVLLGQKSTRGPGTPLPCAQQEYWEVLARWLLSWTARLGPSVVRARSKCGRSQGPCCACWAPLDTKGHQPQQTACRVQPGWKDCR